MDRIVKDAPKFNPDKPRSDYPLSGGQTGPAWRTAWAMLQGQSDLNAWLPAKTIVEHVATETGVAEGTIRNVLIAAARAGILERSVRLHERRNWTHYRITKAHR